MAAMRCPNCDRAWPCASGYSTCPYCPEYNTVYESGVEAMTVELAAAHRTFAEFYATYDEERVRRGEPTPEALGAIDAKREIELRRGRADQINQLEAAL